MSYDYGKIIQFKNARKSVCMIVYPIYRSIWLVRVIVVVKLLWAELDKTFTTLEVCKINNYNDDNSIIEL